MLKRRSFWIILFCCLLAAGAAGVVLKKKNRPAPAPVAAAAQTPEVMEFLPGDITQAKTTELRQLLPLSGTLRPLNQATVKAKVPGEVRDVLVREGEAVKEGQVVIRMDTSDYQAKVEQARGALRAAQGQLDIATKSRNNNKALLEKGFISQAAFDNTDSQYDIARANVESARAALNVTQNALKDATIRAPISGLVSSRNVQPGEKVSADNRLLDVVDLRKMEMEAPVPASDIMLVALGQEVRVKVEGMPQALNGKVVRINPSTEPGSRSIMVYVQIDNPQQTLRVGMFGEAKLTTAKRDDVLTVPQSAVQTDGDATFVYAIENSKLVRKPVKLGLKGNNGEGDAVQVLSGLESGAQIVKANLGNLRPGTTVKFARSGGPSAAAASSGATTVQ